MLTTYLLAKLLILCKAAEGRFLQLSAVSCQTLVSSLVLKKRVPWLGLRCSVGMTTLEKAATLIG